MKYRIVYTVRANNHLADITDWILEQAPLSAEPWLEKLSESVNSLLENPARCPLAPENESHEFDIRHLLFGKRHGQYRILFTIQDREVIILDIRHSNRTWLEPGSLK